MFTVYPSNRLEDLIVLAQKVLEQRQTGIFEPDIILVESQGMQHWLNLQLAKMQHISMNIEFPMPSRFIWDWARKILGDQAIPRKSPYSREILSFRIDQIFCRPEWMQDAETQVVSNYWFAPGSKSDQAPDPLRRFQLASRLADVFEQYLIYRPDWLAAWQAGELVAELQDDNAEPLTQVWQAKLWRLLIEQEAYHPSSLQDLAIEKLAEHKDKLPQQILIFGINTLAPKPLEFFQAIAEHTHVHLFHLNPCVEFWGDLKTEKQKVKAQLENQQQASRVQQVDDWLATEQINNPLLANLGGQGRAFFNALQKVNSYEISAFDLFDHDELAEDGLTPLEPSVLQHIQQDILSLSDARQVPQVKQDDSIYISACHSALREIQTLHDYLLYQFEQDPSLKAQDVVVMCPAIEDYAPYIDAVFKRPWQENLSGSPKLPCSIADRAYIDSEPLINTFADLLSLPDSRFEVSKILAYLRLPALQIKFGFSDDELLKIETWLQQAAVHWGLNAEHKMQQSEVVGIGEKYSWHWGLKRLLLGFAWGNQEHIYYPDLEQTDERTGELWLPYIEGSDAVLLGRLCLLLDRLSFHSQSLLQLRTPQAWLAYLTELKVDFFTIEAEEETASDIIDAAISSLTERTELADYQQALDLTTVRYYLNQHFSQADPANHFLTGQITFCSMVPMRSIPFKIIAILGLNDGAYPRQSIPISFDLMTQAPARMGDRSRRSDDRYLFLEALISTRDKFYLSYQGRDIRNNNPREPSLILKELMDYLALGYGWQFDFSAQAANNQLHIQTLHPFSLDNYSAAADKIKSFDVNWCRLAQPQARQQDSEFKLEAFELAESGISVDDLVRFFADPLAVFARIRLGLNFNDYQQLSDDNEPFSLDGLTEYQLKQDFYQLAAASLLETGILADDSVEAQAEVISSEWLAERYQLSGLLPDSDLASESLAQVKQLTSDFTQSLAEFPTFAKAQHTLACQFDQGKSSVNLVADVYQFSSHDSVQGVLSWRPAQAKPKDHIRLWLNHLMVTAATNQAVTSFAKFVNSKDSSIQSLILRPLDVASAKSELSKFVDLYLAGLNQPNLHYVDIAHCLINKNESKPAETLAHDAKLSRELQKALADKLDLNEYFAWFAAQGYIQLDESSCANLQASLIELYLPLYQNLEELKPEKSK
ncbi:exodeoxyribonuclease V subunit gamma [Catenovulum maritimum]|uniref:exodeoxyribonuclease V subunit gamma n=1 Tax=Catenovulum maritimum TaxID=1513271 RepID=UPI00066125E7|nr:exodeoxyribonuclease V subunit gamma [Catenovulum maritimum]